jgi:hypothetical protein
VIWFLDSAVAALAGAAIEMRPESPAVIRTVARSFMRVPPYERIIIELAFRRREISSKLEPLRRRGLDNARVRPLFGTFHDGEAYGG